MPTEVTYRSRDFLNLEGFNAGAHLITAVCAGTSTWQGHVREWFDADLVIADCNRVVSLDFSANDVANRENALFKVRLLRDRVVAFAEVFEETLDRYQPDRVREGLILPDRFGRLPSAKQD